MRLIDADKLKKHYEWWKYGTEEHTLDEMREIFNTIVDLQPTIEADIKCEDCKTIIALKAALEPVKRGKWIWDDEGYHCSECFYHAYGETGEVLSGNWHYCPNCGAKMDAEES